MNDFMYLVLDDWGWHPFWAKIDPDTEEIKTDAIYEGVIGAPMSWSRTKSFEQAVQAFLDYAPCFKEPRITTRYFKCDKVAPAHMDELIEFVKSIYKDCIKELAAKHMEIVNDVLRGGKGKKRPEGDRI